MNPKAIFQEKLAELRSGLLVLDLGDSIKDVEQATNNMFSLKLSQGCVDELTVESLTQFIEAVSTLFGNCLVQSKPSGVDLLFYCWFDAQAGELRYSAIRFISEDTTPPFACQIRTASSPREIAEIFLDYKYHDGVPCAEVSDRANDEHVSEPFELLIWTRVFRN